MPDDKETGTNAELKLTALDDEGLQVISAHLQDAIIRIKDMTYLKSENRFVAVVNRFDWSKAQSDTKGQYQRRNSGLDFSRVLNVRTRNIDRSASDDVLELLSIMFVEGEAPSGEIVLTFAGGGEVQLNVECIETRMSDLGASWSAKSLPQHAFDDD